jgi:hypothetical protein
MHPSAVFLSCHFQAGTEIHQWLEHRSHFQFCCINLVHHVHTDRMSDLTWNVLLKTACNSVWDLSLRKRIYI